MILQLTATLRLKNILAQRKDCPPDTCRLDYVATGSMPPPSAVVEGESNQMVIGQQFCNKLLLFAGSIHSLMSSLINESGTKKMCNVSGTVHVVNPLGPEGLHWSNRTQLLIVVKFC